MNEEFVYNQIILELVGYLPKLRLVEWFLVPYALPRTTRMFAPYWSWKIQQNDCGENPVLFRTLHDANLQPLERPPTYTLTRGFSLPPNHKSTRLC